MKREQLQAHGTFTAGNKFFGGSNPFALAHEYGSPVYVYNERILRARCREVRNLVGMDRFTASYSAKANCNLHLLKIVQEEGLKVDAMSPGEIHIQLKAGFAPEDILFVSNNVSGREMRFAVDHGVTVSIDSVSQLDLYGRVNPGGRVAIRFNPGLGAGHHAKVVTAGAETKFGVTPDAIDDLKEIIEKYDLKLIGINQHIGSLFMDGHDYLKAARNLLEIAKNFKELEFIDFGGGFGVPYRKLDGQGRLDMHTLGEGLRKIIETFEQETGWKPTYQVEPGRYVVAECGILLGTVHAVKDVCGTRYAGTDIGFNVLQRPVMYDSHHDIEVYRFGGEPFGPDEPFTVVGNICETGDIIARDRWLPELSENDLLAILDAGAYGYSMASNYNHRLRPAEILIRADGRPKCIRRADTMDDLLRNYDL